MPHELSVLRILRKTNRYFDLGFAGAPNGGRNPRNLSLLQMLRGWRAGESVVTRHRHESIGTDVTKP
jgi:hypothetical protein